LHESVRVTLCTLLFVYMLTCKHSEVCIFKTHVNMLAYEIDFLHLKLIKNLSQSIFLYIVLIGSRQSHP
jgi:hypothetical protein